MNGAQRSRHPPSGPYLTVEKSLKDEPPLFCVLRQEHSLASNGVHDGKDGEEEGGK